MRFRSGLLPLFGEGFLSPLVERLVRSLPYLTRWCPPLREQCAKVGQPPLFYHLHTRNFTTDWGAPVPRFSMWNFGGLTTRQLAERVRAAIDRDEVFDRAAALAYYFLLALLPLLFVALSILGTVAHGNPQFRQQLITYMSSIMPGQASQVISQSLEEIMRANGGATISLGLLAALWTASGGMTAVQQALNATHDVRESRKYWVAKGVALWLTAAVSALVVVALVLILYGPAIANAIFGTVGLANVVGWIWKIVQWPVAVFFVILAIELMYYAAPDVHKREWQWLTPGSVLGVAVWLLASFAFRVYLSFFNSYSKTYGSLGVLVILMLWFYITGFAILAGSEVNAEIMNAEEGGRLGGRQPPMPIRAA